MPTMYSHFTSGAIVKSWDGLADLDLLAQLAGFRGLVLLVDEFEDVIQNLTRVNFKQAAFWNLFHFVPEAIILPVSLTSQ